VAYYTGSGNTLTWDEASESDFQHFRVYRSTDPNFIPGAANLVHSTVFPSWVDPDFDGSAVTYQVTSTDFAGNESDPASAATVTSLPDTGALRSFALHQNQPNPFNPMTTIAYSVPSGGGHVTLEILDVRGRRIRTIVDKLEAEGRRRATWDGRDDSGLQVASGTYFYRLTAPGYAQTRKMSLLK
jgi:hypothetical protein